MQRLAFGIAFSLLAAAVLGTSSMAQTWPQRSVKFIVTLGRAWSPTA
jgi:hypothetical protein